MLWLKAFHIVFVVAWFAGLFYLPRLFVYHVNADAVTQERLKIMERRLFAMMTLGAVLASGFAVAMLVLAPGFLKFAWMDLKLVLAALLIGYHLWCLRLMKAFRNNQNRHSERWYRYFNELPTLLLIAIVILVVVKPF
jgi:protoporphyrinogen IX oxidase